jgi:preprotein translocase SecE subunit
MKDVIQFFSEVRLELSRVVWPKFDEFIGSTLVVIVIVTVFAIYLGGIDFGLSNLARYIFEQYGMQ